jgi:glycosyltransferase involved in cell wall biosynthesis
MFTLSIIVPAYNEEESIEECLASLTSQEDKNFELIVVNNNSTDNTEEIAQKYADSVFLEKKKGYHNAVKKGIENTSGEIIAVCDADSVYPENWTRIIKEEFSENKKLVGVYGKVEFCDGNKISNFFSERIFFLFMIVMKKMGIDVCNGWNFAIKRKAYVEVGGYNPAIYNQEGLDINLGMRLSKAGEMKFSKKMMAKTSTRRIKKLGLLKFVAINLDLYYRLLTKRAVKRTYEEYNIKY